MEIVQEWDPELHRLMMKVSDAWGEVKKYIASKNDNAAT